MHLPVRPATSEAQLGPQPGTDGNHPRLGRLGLFAAQDEPNGIALLVVSNLRPQRAGDDEGDVLLIDFDLSQGVAKLAVTDEEELEIADPRSS